MFKDIDLKEHGYLLLAIAFVMIAVPYTVSNVPMLFAVFFLMAIYLLWMLKKGKPGVGVFLIALSLCIPTYLMDKEIEHYYEGIRWISYALEFYIILIWYIMYKNKYCSAPFPKVFIVIALFSILSLLYPSASFFTMVRRIVDWILCIHVLFYICSNDKISFSTLYVSLSFTFIITGIYTILDYFGHLGPYSSVFINQDLLNHQGYDIIIRAKGLLGNSLVLTGACMAFNALILIRYYLTNRFDVIMAVFCIFVSALTISRTVFVIIAFQYLFVIFLGKGSTVFKSLISVGVVGLLVLTIIGTNYGGGVYGALTNRFIDTGMLDAHRSSAFSLAFSIFGVNPFGVGLENIPEYIHNSTFVGTNTDALTLDNTILTQIVAYGIFSPIALYFFFYYLFHIKSFSQVKTINYCALLICLTWVALGFSFRVEHYSSLNVLFFGFLGYLFNEAVYSNKLNYVDA